LFVVHNPRGYIHRVADLNDLRRRMTMVHE